MKKTGLITLLLMAALAGQGQQVTLDGAEVMATAEKVAGYFLSHYPDVGADSHVGGKTRNSRIWTRGVFYEGLLNMYREQQRSEWLKYAVDWGEFHEWYSCNDSQKRHADFQCCGQAYLQLYMMAPTEQKRMAHIKMRIDDMMKTSQVDDWYWIDAIQMAMPIFAMLGTITGDAAYWDRMNEMYRFTRNKHGGDRKAGGKPLFNESTGLWYRDYQFDPPYRDLTEKDKDCYWSRGNGWVYMALTRIMQFAPGDEAHRAEYVQDFLAMSEALRKCQRQDGSWNVSLAAPSNYGQKGSEGPEMTGTSLFVGGMAYGVRTGLLDEPTYLPAIKQGWEAMRRAVHEDTGFVGYLQGSGSKPEDGGVITYNSVPDFEDFGYGCWLWGAAEVHALADKMQGANGIKTIITPVEDDDCYDLMGRKVERPLPGHLYIRGGKKVVFTPDAR
ncbi:MAG: glycoside hydrolase family 88 protein [Prevotella sp.]|nr:glycoside hydrolase family 88 protein [Prevotella sp.]